jgi:hypothetical protein
MFGRSTLAGIALTAVTALASSGCGAAHAPTAADGRATGTQEPGVTTVIAVSIDALNPAAIGRLGPGRAPVLHRLITEGASTLDARTAREQTNTLPNHTGMVTGRRIDAGRRGHGVVWNDERLRPPTVQAAAGHPVASVFSVVHGHGLRTGLFASKQKFSLFERSWTAGVDRDVIREDNTRLVRAVRRDIAHRSRAFRFVHLSAPDVAGHAHGFMGPAYLDAVAATDRRLGRIIDAVEARGDLADHTVVIVTADHGGRGVTHRDETKPFNYRVPFIVWGPGVAAGADLYELNPDYAEPGQARPSYAGRQPVRNADVANLATDLLGLGPVPGSELDAAQDLSVR